MPVAVSGAPIQPVLLPTSAQKTTVDESPLLSPVAMAASFVDGSQDSNGSRRSDRTRKRSTALGDEFELEGDAGKRVKVSNTN